MSSCIYKDVWIYLLIFILKNAIGKQLLPEALQKCDLNVLFPACAQPGSFVVENLSGVREEGTTPFQKTGGSPSSGRALSQWRAE